MMSPCRRRILLIFGGFFLAAALFVPYRSTRVYLDRDTYSNLVWQRTFHNGGYMFLPRFLRISAERRTDSADPDVRYALLRAQNVASVRYDLNALFLFFELSVIGLLGAYNYCFLCRWKRRRRAEAELSLQGGAE